MLAAAIQIALAAETQTAASAAGSEPGYYVVSLRVATDPGQDEAAGKALMGHIAHLGELYAQGVLFMAGPYDEVGHEGISIVTASSPAEARGYFESDPSVQAGLMQITGVHSWWAAFSRPDNRIFTVEQFTEMMSAQGSGKAAAAAGHTPQTAQSAGATEAGAATSDGAMAMAPGSIDFIEIPSSNPAASQSFYSSLFGWTADNQEGFAFFTASDGMMGMFTPEAKPAAPQTGPVFYINCESVKAQLAAIEAAGGKTVLPPMALPQNWGFVAVFSDPEGNAVGLWSSGE